MKCFALVFWCHFEYKIVLYYFEQLLVKEILDNGPWRRYGLTPLVITKLAKYVTISVFCLIP